MPWIFNLPGGVVRQYPSQQEDPENGLSFQEAEARVRREINPRLVNTEDPSSDPGFRDRSPWAQDSLRNAAEARQFFRDMGDQFSGGIADIGTAVGQMVNIFDPTTSSARERGDVPIGDRMANASREWGQEQMASLSPEMLHDQNDPDWLSPGNVAATMGRSAPSLIPTLVGGALSGGSITVPAIIEGTMGGGSVADTIDESIRDVAAFDPEMFINSPLGQQALAETDGDYPRAVELAANRAKGAAPVLAGAITAGLSRVGENIFRAGQGPARRTVSSIVARIALGGAREGLEETLQSTQEQVAGNLAIGQIDGRSMWEGADQAAIMGGIAGAGMGATMGGVDVALSNMRRRGGGSGTGPAQVQGPVMPPPGHPNRGPATGNGNPPGWTAPNTEGSEDADFTYPGENILEGGRTDEQPQSRPRGWKKGTESWAEPAPESEAQAQEEAQSPQEAEERIMEVASQGDPEDVLDSDFDEEYAQSLNDRFQSLGMAAREMPAENDVAERRTEPVPMYRYNREDIEASDEDALAVYRGAQMEERPISETATFQAYNNLSDNLFADEEGDPSQAHGFGLRVVDKLKDGTERVSYVDIGARTMEEAAAQATSRATQDSGAEETVETPSEQQNIAAPPEPTQSNADLDEALTEAAPETGTNVVPTGRVRNLKPAANEALNTYRTKGEQGLQEYLGGLNVTATRSLLRNLGGQGVRGDSIAQTRGKIVQRVRQMAKSSDARGLPAPEAPTARMEVTQVADPVQAPVAPKATPKPKAAPVRGQSEKRTQTSDKPQEEAPASDGAKRHRSPAQIKAALREVSSLEDDAYDAAVAKLKITPEEAAAVREAMKTDNGLDNLRPVFNDALRVGKNTKKSKQTEEAPKAEPKKKAPSNEPKESPARVRKERDAGDRAMAESLARGQPKDYDVVRRSVEQWLEVERDRIGARSDASWYKQWPIARQEALIQRTWNAVNGRGGAMESRGPDGVASGAGNRVPYEVNPFSGSVSYEPLPGVRVEVTTDGRLRFSVDGKTMSGSGTAEQAQRVTRAVYRMLLQDIERTGRQSYNWRPVTTRQAELYRFAMSRRAPEGYAFRESGRTMYLERTSPSTATPSSRETVLRRLDEIQGIVDGLRGPRSQAPNAGKMESRDYGKGKTAGDLNPLQMFSRAERMARTFPEESSTRMHMLKWLEKRVRKAELKFIDMSEFLHGGPTGNALRDKATRQELVDYITNRKLRLTVRYAYGQPGNTFSYKDRFDTDRGLERDMDEAAKFAAFSGEVDEDGAGSLGQYNEYTLLGGDVIKHNYLEVGIVIEPGQPGSEFTDSHVGGKGAVAGLLVSDLPIEVNGKKLNAFAIHQGQSDYHDAKPEQYGDGVSINKRLVELRKELNRQREENGRYDDADWAEYRDLEYKNAQQRDINTPYRETHPELMFRVAFMMAVSSDHDALVWPTADTIRMYPGHSTYKGSFYDERLPKYAESWLKEYGAHVTKQAFDYKGNEEEYSSVADFVDDAMRDEGRDIAGDLIPSGIEANVEDAFHDALDELRGVLSYEHEAWIEGLQMEGRENNPNLKNRFDVDFYDTARKHAIAAARNSFERNVGYHDDLLNDETSPSKADVIRVFTDFADTYLSRFVDVLEEAYEKKSGDTTNAEVYVMKITPEMKEAFRETGIPMFSQGNAGEKPIQADDNPIPNKAWVNEMERAIKAAAACAAGQAAAGAAFGALATGAALGAAGAVPIANLIAAEGDSLRWMTDFRQRQQQEKIDAGLAPANDYVDENGNYRPPQTDEEGYVLPPIPVAGGGRPLRPARPYTQAELAAAEREIRSLAPRATITPENVSRQADIRRYGLRNGSGAPDDAPPRE